MNKYNKTSYIKNKEYFTMRELKCASLTCNFINIYLFKVKNYTSNLSTIKNYIFI